MKEDKIVRYNVLIAALVFLNFWYLLLLNTVSTENGALWLQTLAPFVTLVAPALVFAWIEKKKSNESLKNTLYSCYRLKKCGIKNLLLALSVGIASYFTYVYVYSAVVCFYEYATESIQLYTASQTFQWKMLAAMLSQGLVVPFVTELLFRGAGRNAYGNTRFQYVMPVLFGLLLTYSTDGWIKWLFLGVVATVAVARTGSVLPPVISSSVFSLLGVTMGNFLQFPFMFQGVSSLETALFYGFISSAIGIFALGVTTICLMLMNGRENRGKEKISVDGKITACGVVGIYILLLVISALM